MAKAKTYYPPRTFDDDLAALVQLYSTKKWSFSNVDLKQLAKDVQSQRDERSAYDAAEAEWRSAQQSFGTAQEQRYQRFSAALNAARGAFKNDKAVSKQLDKFKRSVTRAAKPKNQE